MADEKKKNETAKGAENPLESLKGNPNVAGFPDWLLDMRPHDIISLPFDDLSYTDDFYEMALTTLYLRKWHYDKIHFYHHVVLTPVLWPFFFPRPSAITVKLVGIRWLILIFMLAALIAGVYGIARILDTPALVSLILGVGGLSLLLINTFIGMDYFSRWRRVYRNLGKAHLDALLPKKKKTKKKK
jgi:hypothetical protein